MNTAPRFLLSNILALTALACSGSTPPSPAVDPHTSTETNASSGVSPAPTHGANVEQHLNSAQRLELQTLATALEGARVMDAAQVKAKRAVAWQSLTYDPKAAEFMDVIQGSALALNSAELDKLETNGFVISKRQGFATFVRGYAEIYSEHLPVYISADGILDSVHSSYDQLLMSTELAALIPKVQSILDGLHAAVGNATAAPGAIDLDLYLAVARSLLSGQSVAPVAGADQSKIQALVAKAGAAEGQEQVNLFGAPRTIDTSQFTPRGHYTDDERLSRYFKAMMWLGRIDFRLLETQPDGTALLRREQVNAALLLRKLLSEQGLNDWKQVDSALQVFVGPSDYMVVTELDQLTADLGGYDQALAATDEQVTQALVAGGYGVQLIASHIMVNDGSTKTLPLNRSFALFGQRYILDSHVFSQVVYDRTGDKRMMPNPLDVAFAALGNDGALSLLQPEFEAYPLDYAGNLESTRLLADAHGDEFWNSNLYNLWLGSLRKLSPKQAEVTDPAAAGLPAVAATEAWNRRILNTQLASWAELRHDTLLYAKQSYTGVPGCEYPDAYVDPYPEFYATLGQYADVGLALTNQLGESLGSAQSQVVGYFQNLKSSMAMLHDMAQSQRDGVAFTDEQLAFINDAVRIEQQSVVCTTVPVPDGWLADLYLNRDKSIEEDLLVADVHTQPADEVGNPVGKILHVGTGYPRLMVTTVDTCQGPRAYAGVAFAYHETITSDYKRLTDQDWSTQASSAAEVPWMSTVLAE